MDKSTHIPGTFLDVVEVNDGIVYRSGGQDHHGVVVAKSSSGVTVSDGRGVRTVAEKDIVHLKRRLKGRNVFIARDKATAESAFVIGGRRRNPKSSKSSKSGRGGGRAHKSRGWKLIDSAARAKQYPGKWEHDTYRALPIGSEIKIGLEKDGPNGGGERFWVKVTGRKAGRYQGRVMNSLVEDHGIRRGDLISFSGRNILDAEVPASKAKAKGKKNPARRGSARRRKNISEGYWSGGSFHPIRSAADYDPTLAGEGHLSKDAAGYGKAAKVRKAKRKGKAAVGSAARTTKKQRYFKTKAKGKAKGKGKGKSTRTRTQTRKNPDRIAGYVKTSTPERKGQRVTITDFQGKVLGSGVITSIWKTPKSHLSNVQMSITAVIDGVTYTGRSAGNGMLWTGKASKRKR